MAALLVGSDVTLVFYDAFSFFLQLKCVDIIFRFPRGNAFFFNFRHPLFFKTTSGGYCRDYKQALEVSECDSYFIWEENVN